MKILKSEPIEYEDKITFPSVESVAEFFNISVEKAQYLHDNEREKYEKMINKYWEQVNIQMIKKDEDRIKKAKLQTQKMQEAVIEKEREIYY